MDPSPRIVFLDRDTTDAGDIDLGGIEALGVLETYGMTRPDETAERISGANIVLSNKVVIGAAEMDAATGLRLIQVVATGVNNVDLEAARERDVAVCNVSGYSTPSVAQHVFAFLLNHATKVDRYTAEPEKWAESPIFTRLDHPVFEWAGKTLGIAGLGTIGREVASIGRAFGMRVVALAREGAGESGGIERLPRERFFAESDAITLHCPLTPDTHHLINADTLDLMRPQAILVNTGRGDLVAENDLLDALERGSIAAAYVDVLSQEPPSPGHPFVTDPPPNLFVTPHTAWSSLEARRRLIDGVVRNITAFLRGERENRVD